jgi:hypothetical protein
MCGIKNLKKNKTMNDWLKECDIKRYNKIINSTQITNRENGITKNGIFIPYLSLSTKRKK